MNDADLELLNEFVIESRELLERVEPDLLSLDTSGGEIDNDVVHRIFRAVHSVKGAAGFFGLHKIGKLAHAAENVLGEVREARLEPTPELIDLLLRSNDLLRAMVEDVEGSESVDSSEELAALDHYLKTGGPPPEEGAAPPPEPEPEPEREPEAESAPAALPSAVSAQDLAAEFSLSEEVRTELLRHGKRLYRLELELNRDVLGIGKSLAEFMEHLGSVGEVYACNPALDELQWQESMPDTTVDFVVTLSSVLGPEIAAIGFGLPAERIAELPLRTDGGGPRVPTPAAAPKTAPAASPAPKAAPAAKKAPAKAAKKAPAPKPKAAAKTDKAEESQKTGSGKALGSETVRVKTSVLNALMEMAGEMVLSRNRLVRALEEHLERLDGVGPILHQVSSITTSIQDQIMRTRLQPVGTLFGRFRRVVRDTSRKLGKEVHLVTSGEDVELDKTIVEGLSDPLNHLIRNSLDHGLEMPADREAVGKAPAGTVTISAYHEAGMVNIDIRDDGRGINIERVKLKAFEKGLMSEDDLDRLSDREAANLIMLPGFSTAEKITDVSGRGVGMDVVRTNIEKLGGTVDLVSVAGQGTTVNLKLPLTLAIVTSLIVEAEQQRFALPQVGLEEVIRLRPGEGSEQIERLRGADVLRHRGKLLPVVRLVDVLDIQRTYIDPKTGERKPDRRGRLGDRRGGKKAAADPRWAQRRSGGDRRQSLANVQRILVLRLGRNRFGLVVDRIVDNEEIVVKPLSRFVQACPCFSGATILGDGTISMILDPIGIAQQANLRFADLASEASEEAKAAQRRNLREQVPMVLFSVGGEEVFAMPLGQVARIEKIQSSDIQTVGSREYLTYRGATLRLVRLDDYLPVGGAADEPETLHVIIPRLGNNSAGFICTEVLDAKDLDLEADRETIRVDGIFGTIIHEGRIVLLLDSYGLLATADPESYATWTDSDATGDGPARVLLVEDTPFFQLVTSDYLTRLGLDVSVAQDGLVAFGMLEEGDFDLVLTDLRMPELDGPGLLSRMRTEQRFGSIPVIALTSQNASTSVDDGLKEFDGVVTKLDRPALVENVARLLADRGAEVSA